MKNKEYEILNKFCGAVIYKSLMSLTHFGMMGALEILNDQNGIITKEDLKQDILVWFLENQSEWTIDRFDRVRFANDDDWKEIFSVCRKSVYGMTARHYKRQAYSLDGLTVGAENDVAFWASWAGNLDDAEFSTDVQSIIDSLTDIEYEFFSLRWEGFTVNECAELMEKTVSQVRTIQKHIREKYKSGHVTSLTDGNSKRVFEWYTGQRDQYTWSVIPAHGSSKKPCKSEITPEYSIKYDNYDAYLDSVVKPYNDYAHWLLHRYLLAEK